MARLVWGGVVTVVLVAVLLLFVFPTRTYLDQRHQLAVAAQRLRLLSTQNGLLAARIDTLHTDAEIERIARGQYHLVRPGERAFAILPAPPVSAATSPAVGLPAHRASGWSRLWHRLTSFL